MSYIDFNCIYRYKVQVKHLLYEDQQGIIQSQEVLINISKRVYKVYINDFHMYIYFKCLILDIGMNFHLFLKPIDWFLILHASRCLFHYIKYLCT